MIPAQLVQALAVFHDLACTAAIVVVVIYLRPLSLYYRDRNHRP